MGSSSRAGFHVRSVTAVCTKTLSSTIASPNGMPQSSIVPMSICSEAAMARAAAPGMTMSRPTSSPIASAPANGATLRPVRWAMAFAIGAMMTSATSK